MVRTHCATYNHEPYIIDALKGFVMQQTNFPMVFTIVDDASTDHNAKVIRSFVNENFDLLDTSVAYDEDTDYGHVTFAQHRTNKNCYFAVVYLNENHYSQHKSKAPYLEKWMDTRYIALCEGDDYWIDPQKLQKQVDFLEEHEDFVLCAHNSITIQESTGKMGCFNGRIKKNVFGYEDVIRKDWFLPTQSLLYRKETFDRNSIEKSFFNGDYCLQLCLTKDGGLIHYSNECMAVYRRGVGVSKSVSMYDNNMRLIELLEYMRVRSDSKYDSIFEERIQELKLQNEHFKELEQYGINGKKPWYRIRYKVLALFVKLLSFKEPKVVFYKDYGG